MKTGSIILQCFIQSWIESANYSEQIELYISQKADLSEWDTDIKDYETKDQNVETLILKLNAY